MIRDDGWGGCLFGPTGVMGWMGGGEQSGPSRMMYVSPPSIPIQSPTHNWSLFSAAGRNHSASRARGGIRTNQVHTRVRFAPAGSRGLRRRCPILSVSIHFASLRPLDSTLFSLRFFIRSQLPIIYCTYFAAYFPTPVDPVPPATTTTITIATSNSSPHTQPPQPQPFLFPPPFAFLVFD